jgi:hypothetical protein
MAEALPDRPPPRHSSSLGGKDNALRACRQGEPRRGRRVVGPAFPFWPALRRLDNANICLRDQRQAPSKLSKIVRRRAPRPSSLDFSPEAEDGFTRKNLPMVSRLPFRSTPLAQRELRSSVGSPLRVLVV